MKLKVNNNIIIFRKSVQPLYIYRNNKLYMVSISRKILLKPGIYLFKNLHEKLFIKYDYKDYNLTDTDIDKTASKFGIERQRNFGQFDILKQKKNKVSIDTYNRKIYFRRDILKLPVECKLFLLFHEIGHMYFNDETKCDLFACELFKRKGLNSDQIIIACTEVLENKPENMVRLEKIKKYLYE